MDLHGSKTEKNLLTAFAGESQARNRYTYFSKVAKKEGYIQISKVFEVTADQEKEHAKRLFKFMTGGKVEITAEFPFGVIGNTAENLQSSINGEHFEHSSMYPGYAKIAKEEGFNEIADVFENIAIAEKNHEKRFKAFLENIKQKKVFKRDKKVIWYCQNCGYLHESLEAPNECPSCAHPQAFFSIIDESFL